MEYKNLKVLNEIKVSKQLPKIPGMLKAIPILGSLTLGPMIATKFMDPPTEKILKKKQDKIHKKLGKPAIIRENMNIKTFIPKNAQLFLKKKYIKAIKQNKEDNKNNEINEHKLKLGQKLILALRRPVKEIRKVKYFLSQPIPAAKSLAKTTALGTLGMAGWGALDSAGRIKNYEKEYTTAIKRADAKTPQQRIPSD